MPQTVVRVLDAARLPSSAMVRPPGCVSETDLTDRCLGCGDCVAVCPADLISLDPEDLPVIPSIEACAFCGLCADVCMQSAIEFTPRTKAGFDRLQSAEPMHGHFVLGAWTA